MHIQKKRPLRETFLKMKTGLHNAYMITERTTDIHRGAAFFVALFDAVQVSDTTDDDSSNADGQHNFLFKTGIHMHI